MDKFSFFGNIDGEFVDELYQRYQTNKNKRKTNKTNEQTNKPIKTNEKQI